MISSCGGERLGPELRFVTAQPADQNACPREDRRDVPQGTDRMRLTMRYQRDGKIALCDVMLARGQKPRFNIPYGGGPIDFIAEAFDMNNLRLATGSVHLPEVKFGDDVPEIRLFASEGFRCVPRVQLGRGRAFHSATLLPNGQILLVGGVTTASKSNDASNRYFLTDSVEVFDPSRLQNATRDALPQPVIRIDSTTAAPVRAFHHAAYLDTVDGKYRVLLVGGVSAPSDGMPALKESTGDPQRGTLRFQHEATVKVAPTEIITYDPAAATLSRQTLSSMMLPLATAAFAGGAPMPGGGVMIAGGTQYSGGAEAAHLEAALTKDAKAVVKTALAESRLGPGMVPLGERVAMLVGGGGDPAMNYFLRVDFSAMTPSVKAYARAGGVALPVLMYPTVTLLAAKPLSFLVSGGLEYGGMGQAALDPPQLGPVIVDDTGVGTSLTVSAAKLGAGLAVKCMGAGTYVPVAWNAATVLPPGDRVLLTGGTAANVSCKNCPNGDNSLTCATQQSLIFDIKTETVTLVPAQPGGGGAEQLQFARFGHTQTVLPDGTVLIMGGLSRRKEGMFLSYPVTEVELFNPSRHNPPLVADSDPDDPVAADLTTLGLVRERGVQAYTAGDMSKVPAATCGNLQ